MIDKLKKIELVKILLIDMINNITLNQFYNVDCLSENGLNKIKDKSISLILTDLPFGTTQNEWDSIIPLNDYIEIEINKNINKYTKDEYLLYAFKNNISLIEATKNWENNYKIGLWTHYNRIIKDNGVIILFAQKPFDTIVHNSNKKDFRYEWIWEKPQATGHLNAKKMPMKAHENILVFYKSIPTYNPQKTENHKPMNSGIRKSNVKNFNYNAINKVDLPFGGNTDRFPRSIINISSDKQFSYLHPTQKPIELYEYFIKTYTNENDIIVDNCSGSGTLAIACYNTNRKFICIEKDKKYFEESIDRFEIHKLLYNNIKTLINANKNYTINELIKLVKTNQEIINNILKFKNGNNIINKLNKNIINIFNILERNNVIKL